MESKIEIYKTPNNQTELKVQFDEDTVWLSQSQMADLFDKDVRTINEHIKNIYNSDELAFEATIRNFRIVRQEGLDYATLAALHFLLPPVKPMRPK